MATSKAQTGLLSLSSLPEASGKPATPLVNSPTTLSEPTASRSPLPRHLPPVHPTTFTRGRDRLLNEERLAAAAYGLRPTSSTCGRTGAASGARSGRTPTRGPALIGDDLLGGVAFAFHGTSPGQSWPVGISHRVWISFWGHATQPDRREPDRSAPCVMYVFVWLPVARPLPTAGATGRLPRPARAR